MKYLIQGKLYDPIRFGDEDEDWGSSIGEDPTCGDCGCHVGEIHKDNCDIERCPACGLQMLSCDCGVVYKIEDPNKVDLKSLIAEQEIDNIKQQKEIEKILKEFEKKNRKKDEQMS